MGDGMEVLCFWDEGMKDVNKKNGWKQKEDNASS